MCLVFNWVKNDMFYWWFSSAWKWCLLGLLFISLNLYCRRGRFQWELKENWILAGGPSGISNKLSLGHLNILSGRRVMAIWFWIRLVNARILLVLSSNRYGFLLWDIIFLLLVYFLLSGRLVIRNLVLIGTYWIRFFSTFQVVYLVTHLYQSQM